MKRCVNDGYFLILSVRLLVSAMIKVEIKQ
jgi:hypothetical protein